MKHTSLKISITIPASKSISNRLLILQKTCRDTLQCVFTINNLSTAEDTKLLSDLLNRIKTENVLNYRMALCNSVSSLWFSVKQKKKITQSYTEKTQRNTENNVPILNCENCGTAYRFLTAFLACQSGKWILDGSLRMHQRPIKPLVDTLNNAGADISYLKENGFPPLAINGKPLNANSLIVDSSQSSQYVSALAMILPLLKKDCQLQFSNNAASLQYIDMTLALMQDLGLDIARKENTIAYCHAEIAKNPVNYFVEYDWSAAAVWFLLAALIPKGSIFIEGLQKSKIQADAIISNWTKEFGVETIFQPKGVLLKKTSNKHPDSFEADCKNNLDLVPYIATLCAAMGVKSRLYTIENLALKESNRAQALQTELSKIASVTIKDNSLIINPNNEKMPECICFSSYGDHRIAMSLLALSVCIQKVQIDDVDCIKKSYPDFYHQFSKIFHSSFTAL